MLEAELEVELGYAKEIKGTNRPIIEEMVIQKNVFGNMKIQFLAIKCAIASTFYLISELAIG